MTSTMQAVRSLRRNADFPLSRVPHPTRYQLITAQHWWMLDMLAHMRLTTVHPKAACGVQRLEVISRRSIHTTAMTTLSFQDTPSVCMVKWRAKSLSAPASGNNSAGCLLMGRPTGGRDRRVAPAALASAARSAWACRLLFMYSCTPVSRPLPGTSTACRAAGHPPWHISRGLRKAYRQRQDAATSLQTGCQSPGWRPGNTVAALALQRATDAHPDMSTPDAALVPPRLPAMAAASRQAWTHPRETTHFPVATPIRYLEITWVIVPSHWSTRRAPAARASAATCCRCWVCRPEGRITQAARPPAQRLPLPDVVCLHEDRVTVAALTWTQMQRSQLPPLQQHCLLVQLPAPCPALQRAPLQPPSLLLMPPVGCRCGTCACERPQQDHHLLHWQQQEPVGLPLLLLPPRLGCCHGTCACDFQQPCHNVHFQQQQEAVRLPLLLLPPHLGCHCGTSRGHLGLVACWLQAGPAVGVVDCVAAAPLALTALGWRELVGITLICECPRPRGSCACSLGEQLSSAPGKGYLSNGRLVTHLVSTSGSPAAQSHPLIAPSLAGTASWLGRLQAQDSAPLPVSHRRLLACTALEGPVGRRYRENGACGWAAADHINQWPTHLGSAVCTLSSANTGATSLASSNCPAAAAAGSGDVAGLPPSARRLGAFARLGLPAPAAAKGAISAGSGWPAAAAAGSSLECACACRPLVGCLVLAILGSWTASGLAGVASTGASVPAPLTSGTDTAPAVSTSAAREFDATGGSQIKDDVGSLRLMLLLLHVAAPALALDPLPAEIPLDGPLSGTTGPACCRLSAAASTFCTPGTDGSKGTGPSDEEWARTVAWAVWVPIWCEEAVQADPGFQVFVKIFVKNDFIKDNELATGSPFVDQAVATAMCTEQMSSFQQAFRWHVAGAACHTATAPWSDCSAPRTGCIHVGLRAALQCDGVMKLHCTGGSSPDQVPARGPGLAEWAAWLAGQRLEHTVPAWQLNWSKLCVVTGWPAAPPSSTPLLLCFQHCTTGVLPVADKQPLPCSPCCIAVGGLFYVYATNSNNCNIQCAKSSDLVSWVYMVPAAGPRLMPTWGPVLLPAMLAGVAAKQCFSSAQFVAAQQMLALFTDLHKLLAASAGCYQSHRWQPHFAESANADGWQPLNRWQQVTVEIADLQRGVCKGLEVLPDALPELPSWARGGLTWAPNTVFIQLPDQAPYFVMYFVCRDVSCDKQVVGVAVADTPEGPFKPLGEAPFIAQIQRAGQLPEGAIMPLRKAPFTPTERCIPCRHGMQGHLGSTALPLLQQCFCHGSAAFKLKYSAPSTANLYASKGGTIDPFHFQDDDGQRWLLYKNDGNAVGRTCWLHIRRLQSDGLHFKGPEKLLIRNDLPWEGTVIEAPCLVKRGGRYHLFYSANGFASAEYCIGYATATEVIGPDRLQQMSRMTLQEERDAAGQQRWAGGGAGTGSCTTAAAPEPAVCISLTITYPGLQCLHVQHMWSTDFLVYHSWNPEHTFRACCVTPIIWQKDGTPAAKATWGSDLPLPFS
eukprot:jgi/Astpho2/6496/fgenesh1_pg.00096_%23_25_t